MYRRWCESEGYSSSSPSLARLADFLVWLWEVKKFSVPTIKAYRSMLSAVFRFKIPSISSDPSLKDLIRSFAIQRPRCSSSFPAWDLDVVLKHLMSSAYEPLEQQDLRTITKKALFLVALATAKRVGELHALSRVVPSKGEDLVLSYLSSFVAKTESILNPIPRSFILGL